jgi:hypothetical protein
MVALSYGIDRAAIPIEQLTKSAHQTNKQIGRPGALARARPPAITHLLLPLLLYFGHPSLLTFITLAFWAFVTEAGI